MSRRIAVIGGTGDLGFGLVLRWAKTGEHVVIGSRIQEKAERAVARAKEILGEAVMIEGYENLEATKRADIVVLSVPFEAQLGILKSILPGLSKGKILIDVTVPLATAIGDKPTRVVGIWQGSAAERVKELVPEGVKIVSAFQNMSAEVLQDLDKDVDCDIIVCSDDEEAKRTVMELAEKIPGVRAIDGGPLENSRIVESITALLIGINMRYKVKGAGIRITGLNLGQSSARGLRP